MPALRTELIASLVDKISGPAKTAAASLNTLVRSGSDRGGPTFATRIRKELAYTQIALDKMRTRMVEAIATTYALKTALESPIKAATEFETTMLDLGQKAEFSKSQIAEFGKKIRDLAPQVNQTAQEVAKGYDVLVGAGLNSKLAEGIMPTLAKTATAYRAEIADLADTGMAAIQNLRVKVEEMPAVMDTLAAAGKAGAFELKDMAQYLPGISAQAESVGMKGTRAILELGTALQIVRKGAGDSSEAATNLRNVLQKMTSPETVNHFEKVAGVDLKKALSFYEKKGLTPLEAIVKVTKDIIDKNKGKIKISDLFSDMQMQLGMASMVSHYEEWKKIREDVAKGAGGMVEKDFADRLETMQSKMNALTVQWENFKISLGGAIAPALLPLLTSLTKMATRISDLSEKYPELTRGIVTATAALLAIKIAATGVSWAFLSLKAGLLTTIGVIVRMVTLAAGPWGLAIAAVATGVYLLYQRFSSVREAVNRFAASVIEALNQVIPGIKDFASRAANAFMAFDWYGTGTKIVEALWNGVKAMWSNFVSWMSDAASSLAGKITGAFGIGGAAAKGYDGGAGAGAGASSVGGGVSAPAGRKTSSIGAVNRVIADRLGFTRSNFALSAAQKSEMASAIRKISSDVGISPEHLATAMSFETGGTMDPWKRGPMTKWGRHRGLIQWGEPQRRDYGISQLTSITDQVKAVGKYLKDRGVKPGMGLENIYGAILHGNPTSGLNVRDKNGVSARSGAAMMSRSGHAEALKHLESSGATIFGKPSGAAAKKDKTSKSGAGNHTFNVTVHAPNATKPHEVAAHVERVLKDKVATMFRGSYSDVGMATT